MAIIAACLAVVAVSGHICTTEELLAQQKASDQWSYYQAKSIRRYQSEVARDLALLGCCGNGDKNAKTAEKYASSIEKYKKDGEEIQDKAHEFEKESATAGQRALRLHYGEVFLELAIVMASLSLLTRRKLFLNGALAIAAVGVAIGASALLLH